MLVPEHKDSQQVFYMSTIKSDASRSWCCMDICCREDSRCSTREASRAAWEYAWERLQELGIHRKARDVVFQGERATPGVILTQAQCLGFCRDGPIVRVDDEDGVTFYKFCNKEVIDEIIEKHLINGRVLEKHVAWMSRGKCRSVKS